MHFVILIKPKLDTPVNNMFDVEQGCTEVSWRHQSFLGGKFLVDFECLRGAHYYRIVNFLGKSYFFGF